MDSRKPIDGSQGAVDTPKSRLARQSRLPMAANQGQYEVTTEISVSQKDTRTLGAASTAFQSEVTQALNQFINKRIDKDEALPKTKQLKSIRGKYNALANKPRQLLFNETEPSILETSHQQPSAASAVISIMENVAAGGGINDLRNDILELSRMIEDDNDFGGEPSSSQNGKKEELGLGFASNLASFALQMMEPGRAAVATDNSKNAVANQRNRPIQDNQREPIVEFPDSFTVDDDEISISINQQGPIASETGRAENEPKPWTDLRYGAINIPHEVNPILVPRAIVGAALRVIDLNNPAVNKCMMGSSNTIRQQELARKIAYTAGKPMPVYDLIDPLLTCRNLVIAIGAKMLLGENLNEGNDALADDFAEFQPKKKDNGTHLQDAADDLFLMDQFKREYEKLKAAEPLSDSFLYQQFENVADRRTENFDDLSDDPDIDLMLAPGQEAMPIDFYNKRNILDESLDERLHYAGLDQADDLFGETEPEQRPEIEEQPEEPVPVDPSKEVERFADELSKLLLAQQGLNNATDVNDEERLRAEEEELNRYKEAEYADNKKLAHKAHERKLERTPEPNVIDEYQSDENIFEDLAKSALMLDYAEEESFLPNRAEFVRAKKWTTKPNTEPVEHAQVIIQPASDEEIDIEQPDQNPNIEMLASRIIDSNELEDVQNDILELSQLMDEDAEIPEQIPIKQGPTQISKKPLVGSSSRQIQPPSSRNTNNIVDNRIPNNVQSKIQPPSSKNTNNIIDNRIPNNVKSKIQPPSSKNTNNIIDNRIPNNVKSNMQAPSSKNTNIIVDNNVQSKMLPPSLRNTNITDKRIPSDGYTVLANQMYSEDIRNLSAEIAYIMRKSKPGTKIPEEVEEKQQLICVLEKIILDTNLPHLTPQIERMPPNRQKFICHFAGILANLRDAINRCLGSADRTIVLEEIDGYLKEIARQEKLKPADRTFLQQIKKYFGILESMRNVGAENILKHFPIENAPAPADIKISESPKQNATNMEIMAELQDFQSDMMELSQHIDEEQNASLSTPAYVEPLLQVLDTIDAKARPIIDIPLGIDQIYGYGGDRDIREVYGFLPLPVPGTEFITYCLPDEIDEISKQLQTADKDQKIHNVVTSQFIAWELDRYVQEFMNGNNPAPLLSIVPKPEQMDELVVVLKKTGKLIHMLEEATGRYAAGVQALQATTEPQGMPPEAKFGRNYVDGFPIDIKEIDGFGGKRHILDVYGYMPIRISGSEAVYYALPSEVVEKSQMLENADEQTKNIHIIHNIMLAKAHDQHIKDLLNGEEFSDPYIPPMEEAEIWYDTLDRYGKLDQVLKSANQAVEPDRPVQAHQPERQTPTSESTLGKPAFQSKLGLPSSQPKAHGQPTSAANLQSEMHPTLQKEIVSQSKLVKPTFQSKLGKPTFQSKLAKPSSPPNVHDKADQQTSAANVQSQMRQVPQTEMVSQSKLLKPTFQSKLAKPSSQPKVHDKADQQTSAANVQSQMRQVPQTEMVSQSKLLKPTFQSKLAKPSSQPKVHDKADQQTSAANVQSQMRQVPQTEMDSQSKLLKPTFQSKLAKPSSPPKVHDKADQQTSAANVQSQMRQVPQTEMISQSKLLKPTFQSKLAKPSSQPKVHDKADQQTSSANVQSQMRQVPTTEIVSKKTSKSQTSVIAKPDQGVSQKQVKRDPKPTVYSVEDNLIFSADHRKLSRAIDMLRRFPSGDKGDQKKIDEMTQQIDAIEKVMFESNMKSLIPKVESLPVSRQKSIYQYTGLLVNLRDAIVRCFPTECENRSFFVDEINGYLKKMNKQVDNMVADRQLLQQMRTLCGLEEVLAKMKIPNADQIVIKFRKDARVAKQKLESQDTQPSTGQTVRPKQVDPSQITRPSKNETENNTQLVPSKITRPVSQPELQNAIKNAQRATTSVSSSQLPARPPHVYTVASNEALSLEHRDLTRNMEKLLRQSSSSKGNEQQVVKIRSRLAVLEEKITDSNLPQLLPQIKAMPINVQQFIWKYTSILVDLRDAINRCLGHDDKSILDEINGYLKKIDAQEKLMPSVQPILGNIKQYFGLDKILLKTIKPTAANLVDQFPKENPADNVQSMNTTESPDKPSDIKDLYLMMFEGSASPSPAVKEHNDLCKLILTNPNDTKLMERLCILERVILRVYFPEFRNLKSELNDKETRVVREYAAVILKIADALNRAGELRDPKDRSEYEKACKELAYNIKIMQDLEQHEHALEKHLDEIRAVCGLRNMLLKSTEPSKLVEEFSRIPKEIRPKMQKRVSPKQPISPQTPKHKMIGSALYLLSPLTPERHPTSPKTPKRQPTSPKTPKRSSPGMFPDFDAPEPTYWKNQPDSPIFINTPPTSPLSLPAKPPASPDDSDTSLRTFQARFTLQPVDAYVPLSTLANQFGNEPDLDEEDVLMASSSDDANEFEEPLTREMFAEFINKFKAELYIHQLAARVDPFDEIAVIAADKLEKKIKKLENKLPPIEHPDPNDELDNASEDNVIIESKKFSKRVHDLHLKKQQIPQQPKPVPAQSSEAFVRQLHEEFEVVELNIEKTLKPEPEPEPEDEFDPNEILGDEDMDMEGIFGDEHGPNYIGVDLDNKPVDIRIIRGFGGDVDIREAYGYEKLYLSDTDKDLFTYIPPSHPILNSSLKPHSDMLLTLGAFIAHQLDLRLGDWISRTDIEKLQTELQLPNLIELQQMMPYYGHVLKYLNGQPINEVYEAGSVNTHRQVARPDQDFRPTSSRYRAPIQQLFGKVQSLPYDPQLAQANNLSIQKYLSLQLHLDSLTYSSDDDIEKLSSKSQIAIKETKSEIAAVTDTIIKNNLKNLVQPINSLEERYRSVAKHYALAMVQLKVLISNINPTVKPHHLASTYNDIHRLWTDLKYNYKHVPKLHTIFAEIEKTLGLINIMNYHECWPTVIVRDYGNDADLPDVENLLEEYRENAIPVDEIVFEGGEFDDMPELIDENQSTNDEEEIEEAMASDEEEIEEIEEAPQPRKKLSKKEQAKQAKEEMIERGRKRIKHPPVAPAPVATQETGPRKPRKRDLMGRLIDPDQVPKTEKRVRNRKYDNEDSDEKLSRQEREKLELVERARKRIEERKAARNKPTVESDEELMVKAPVAKKEVKRKPRKRDLMGKLIDPNQEPKTEQRVRNRKYDNEDSDEKLSRQEQEKLELVARGRKRIAERNAARNKQNDQSDEELMVKAPVAKKEMIRKPRKRDLMGKLIDPNLLPKFVPKQKQVAESTEQSDAALINRPSSEAQKTASKESTANPERTKPIKKTEKSPEPPDELWLDVEQHQAIEQQPIEAVPQTQFDLAKQRFTQLKASHNQIQTIEQQPIEAMPLTQFDLAKQRFKQLKAAHNQPVVVEPFDVDSKEYNDKLNRVVLASVGQVKTEPEPQAKIPNQEPKAIPDMLAFYKSTIQQAKEIDEKPKKKPLIYYANRNKKDQPIPRRPQTAQAKSSVRSLIKKPFSQDNFESALEVKVTKTQVSTAEAKSRIQQIKAKAALKLRKLDQV